MNDTKKELINNSSKIFKDLLKQIGIIFLYIFLLTILFLVFKPSLKSNSSTILNLVNILIQLIILIIFLLIFRKTIIPDFYSFKKEGPSHLKKYLKYYLIGLAIMIFSNAIISSIIGMPDNEEANRELLKELPIYSIITMIIFAPIIEELLTRAILKDTFKNKWLYILLSGFIFGFLHCTSVFDNGTILELLYIIPYGTLGSVFAYMYSESNNIWTNISFHSIHNTIGVLLIILGGGL